jgi:hypothetical protein
MADIINPDKTVTTHNADVYWHYAADPVQRSQLLGTFTIGTAQKVLLPIPTDADIVLRCVPRGGRGQGFMGGPGDATPYTISALGVGSGGGTSNFYQQLRVNHGYSYGTVPTPRPALNLLQSFQIKDDAVFGESDLTTFGVPTGMLNLKTDFNASGQIGVTTATVSGTDIVLATTLELQPGQGIYIAGAGVSGSPLVTTCTAVSADGKTITLAAGPFMPGPFTVVQADDTAAVQAWINNAGAPRGDLTMPPGYYRLTSSITLPTTSEGFSIVIHGSGWDQSQFVFQHGGDGFVPTSDLKIDSMVLLDLTIATGTIGNTSGTIDANSRGIGIRMTAPDYTGIYNNFVLQRCRIIGWGRFGLWSDNMEVSWISQCIFRENKSGHVAFVGPDTISPNKQPNANTITDSTFDQAISAGPSDSKRTVTGSMTAGSRTLSGSGFTANDRGKFVIVHGAATGTGDLYSFIDVFNSSSNVTLAHKAQANASGTQLEVFPVNVASILLNRANDTVLDGSTIQGNFADAGSGATNVNSDVNAIKVYNAANCRFIGIHEEDNAGPGGAAIRMENCIAMTIENWGGTSAGPPLFDNAHRSDFALINCHCVSVKNSFFNDRPQFEINDTSSEIQIDDSFIVGDINLWQQDNSWDRLRIGSGVRVYQAADPRTNRLAGNEYSYDGFFGRNLIVNGRLLDGSTAAPEGWTIANPTWWSITRNSQTRGGTFLNVDATTQSPSTFATKIFSQLVPIPDTTGPGLFTCAFDWNLDAQLGVETTGYYVEVRLHPSSGIDEVLQWSTRRFAVVQDTWQVGHIRCFLGSGTGRTIEVQVNVTPGPNNVVMHFANFRLAAGKHIYGAWEEGIHDFGGRMHAPLGFAPIATSGTGSTLPPPVGATYMTMVQDAGVLKLGYNGVWTTVGTTGTVTGVAAGTPQHFTKYNSSGTNIEDTPVIFEFGQVHFKLVGAWLDRTLPLVSVYGTGNTAHMIMVDSDDVCYVGPKFDAATGGSTGAIVCIRTGTGTSQKGRLWVDGINGKLTFNDINTNTYNSTFFLRTASNSHNAITITTQAAAYTGFFLQCMSTTLDIVQFAIDGSGDITRIKHRDYIWPTTTPVTTGTTPNVLGYTGQTTANAPVTLSWIPMTGGSGSIPPGTPNRIVKYDATGSSITNAPAEDATTEFHIMAVGLRVDNNQVVNTLYASPANYCELATCGTDNIVRFGPALNNTGSTSGGYVLIRAGTGSANQGRLWIDGPAGKLTFNDDYLTGNTGTTNSSAFYCRILGAAVHGLTLQSPSTYSGNFIQCFGSIPQNRFVVDFNGDLTVIRAKSYNWPTAITYPASGAMKVLGYTTASGTPQLQWLDPASGGGGAVGPGTIGRLAVFTTTSNVGSSNFAEDTTNLHVAFNEVPTAGHALLIRPAVNDNGVVIYPKAASTGYPFYYQDSVAGERFAIDSAGNIAFIKNLPYIWPSSTPYPTGGAQKVLAYTTTSGTPVLQWLDPTGAGSGANTALSNLTTTSINQSFNFNADASYNIGNGTNRVGAIYLYNGLFIYPRSSTSSSPRACGFIPLVTTAGSNSGECTRFDVYADWNTLQAGDDARFQISSYRTIELHGQRNSSAAPAFTRESTFNANNPAVLILQDADTEGLWINSPGFAGTKNKIRVRQNSADVFTVNAQGSIVGTGGTRFKAKELQLPANTTTAISTDWRTVIVDTVNGPQNLTLPSAQANPGMVVDIIHMRAVQSILTPLTTGYDQLIQVQTIVGTDVFNGWGGGQPQATVFKLAYPGTNGIPNPDNQHKIIRLIADELYAIWWLMPYYL